MILGLVTRKMGFYFIVFWAGYLWICPEDVVWFLTVFNTETAVYGLREVDVFLKSADSLLGTHLGTSVIQVTATDADDANYGNSAKVVYSILQGQPYFSVDPETG